MKKLTSKASPPDIIVFIWAILVALLSATIWRWPSIFPLKQLIDLEEAPSFIYTALQIQATLVAAGFPLLILIIELSKNNSQLTTKVMFYQLSVKHCFFWSALSLIASLVLLPFSNSFLAPTITLALTLLTAVITGFAYWKFLIYTTVTNKIHEAHNNYLVHGMKNLERLNLETFITDVYDHGVYAIKNEDIINYDFSLFWLTKPLLLPGWSCPKDHLDRKITNRMKNSVGPSDNKYCLPYLTESLCSLIVESVYAKHPRFLKPALNTLELVCEFYKNNPYRADHEDPLHCYQNFILNGSATYPQFLQPAIFDDVTESFGRVAKMANQANSTANFLIELENVKNQLLLISNFYNYPEITINKLKNIKIPKPTA